MTADQIFIQAKRMFNYTSDQVCWGRAEYWATLNELSGDSGFSGDCDDFATYCVGMLRNHGLSGRYVTCRVETGELHCVAEHEGWILDNRQEATMPFGHLPYRWIAISGPHSGDPWQSLSDNN